MTGSFEMPPLPGDQAQRSPFTPSFGMIPPRLADRQQLVNEFARALDSGPGSRGRAAFVTGQRGTGKSVMLNVFHQVAAHRGWVSVHANATPGFSTILADTRLPQALAQLKQAPLAAGKHAVTGLTVSAFGFGAGVSTTQENQPDFKPDLEFHLLGLLREAQDLNSGVLVTLDEVHRNNIDELRTVTDAVSTAFGSGLPVAFVAAGLPLSINDLVNDDVSTYLRRAQRIVLPALTMNGAREGIRAPVEEAGKTIDVDALDLAVAATQRYPYLVQLIGDLAWEHAGEAAEIVTADVKSATARARALMFSQVHAPTLSDLSATDHTYLRAMAQDTGASATSDMVKRLGKNARYVNVYRSRLIAAGVIEAPSRGYVQFTLPYMREYLQSL